MVIGVAAALAAAGLLVLSMAGGPHEFSGTLLSNPDPAPPFTLTADTGEPLGLDTFDDKIVLLYFGYTFCPDVCPTTLAELATVMDLLGDESDQVQVVMISVDPARDTPEILAEYMDHFNPTFIGLTGDDADVTDVAAGYGIYYQAQEGTPATGYLVDHWAGVMLIDRTGRLVELFSYGTPAEQIAADISEWL
jgi:protein SCO1/2